MSLRDFVNLQKIGEGSYSSVHKVKRLSDNQEYALKKVKLQGLTEKEKDNALNEIRILASIGHPNMIGYKDAFFDENTHSLCIIMELADNGDLQKKIELAKKRNASIAEEEIWTVALHMLRGLKAMHSRNILHRDLKCANVFITKSDDYKLGDLNVSKVAKRGLVYTQTGTPYYASPEVWRDEPYNSSSDIWSLGCILYEIAALNPPFRAKDMEGLYKKVQKGTFDRIPQRYSNDLQKFIALCLQVSSEKRPSVGQLLANPLLRRNTQFLAESEEEQQQLNQEHLVQEEDLLLNTIRMPKNPRQLKDKLPKAQYNTSNNTVESQKNNRYENYPQNKSHFRNQSLNLNRIQLINSDRKMSQQFTEKDNQSLSDKEIFPSLLDKQQQQLQQQQGRSQEIQKTINAMQPIQIPDMAKLKKYDISPQAIVSDSRSYLESNNKQNILNSKKRILSSVSIQQSEQLKQGYLVEQSPKKLLQQQQQQNFNEDYTVKMQKQQQGSLLMDSPKISVISKKEINPQQSPFSAQAKLSAIEQINSYAKIANLYQKQSKNNSEFSSPQQINNNNSNNNSNRNNYQLQGQNPQYSRPVWWG